LDAVLEPSATIAPGAAITGVTTAAIAAIPGTPLADAAAPIPVGEEYTSALATPAGWTALHAAAMSGQLSALELLLERKAVDVNAVNVYGITALHSAAVTAQDEAAELLLKAGANPDIASFVPTSPSAGSLSACAAHDSAFGTNASGSSKSSEFTFTAYPGLSGRTALQIATGNGHVKVVEVLIRGKANINAARSDGCTPLHIAALSGDSDIAQLLLDAGADPNRLASQNTALPHATPLHLAAHFGHSDIAQLLLDAGADPNIPNAATVTPLQLAAWNGHLDVVRALIANGADLEAADPYEGVQNTALRLAAWQGHLGVVQALIAKGADLEPADSSGRTPLLFAAHDGHIEVVRVLILAGAELEAATEDGRTALFLAAWQNQEDVVRVLLAAGADPNTSRHDGYTVLQMVSMYGFVGVARQLIAAGANVGTTMINNHSPLTLAAGKGNLSVVQLLLGQHPGPTAPVPTGVHAAHHMVLAAKAAIKYANEWGSGMEVWAAVVRAMAGRRGNGEIADEVVEHELMMACEELGPMQDMCEMAAAWDRDGKAVRAAVVEERAALARERKELEQLRRGVQDLIVGAAGVLRQAADAADGAER
jgi:ankyrin repeat protein